MKSKAILILSVALAIVIGATSFLFYDYKKQVAEKKRFERNWIAENETVKEYKTKSGWQAQELTAKETRLSELSKVNTELNDAVKELRLKLKNAESITKIETVIKYVNRDSIVYIEREPGIREFNISDPWFNADVAITECEYIAPGDFKLETRDSTILVSDIKYKGWWFWKKVDKLSITVANKNPHVTNSVQHYEIIK